MCLGVAAAVCDCHLSMARLFDRFDPDREKWSSYLMRAEFYFDSNNITTDQKKKAALCSTMSPETFALLQNLLTREVTNVSYEEVKAALKQHFEEKRNFLAARSDFFRTVQQEGQSITDFLAKLRNKAKECEFEKQCCVKCQDNALRKRLVMGCRHTFIIIIIIIMAGMAVFYVARYRIEERRRWPVITASPRGQCSK